MAVFHASLFVSMQVCCIFCCVCFLLLLKFCKSFTSSNLRWSLHCSAISSLHAYHSSIDYCANTHELSLTLAWCLNWSCACAMLLSNPILIKFGTAEARCMNWALVFQGVLGYCSHYTRQHLRQHENHARKALLRVWARINWSLGDNLFPWLKFFGTFLFLGGQKFVHPSADAKRFVFLDFRQK